MSIPARCGSCRRELLLDQLLEPSEGFRCPFCGFAFAPSYATIAPGLAARILESHAALVRALGELQSMVDGRLLLDRPELKPPATGTIRVEGLQTRTEQVADGVARVQATAGRLAGPMLDKAVPLERGPARGQAPYVVTIRQDGTWYPSLVFSVTDWMLTRAERERP